jgi:hypothetical protein
MRSGILRRMTLALKRPPGPTPPLFGCMVWARMATTLCRWCPSWCSPARLAGIMALSTYLPLADRLAAERAAVNQTVPIFMAHGLSDPVLPCALGVQSRDLLKTLGYAVEWHQYPMPHSVCASEIADIRSYLLGVLPNVNLP